MENSTEKRKLKVYLNYPKPSTQKQIDERLSLVTQICELGYEVVNIEDIAPKERTPINYHRARGEQKEEFRLSVKLQDMLQADIVFNADIFYGNEECGFIFTSAAKTGKVMAHQGNRKNGAFRMAKPELYWGVMRTNKCIYFE